MKLSHIIGIVLASAAIGVLLGVGILYSVYQPRIDDLGLQVSNLNTEVAGLNQTVANQDARISSQASRISGLESDNSALETKLTTSQAEAERYKSQVTSLESKVSQLDDEVSSLQTHLSNIYSSKMTQYYGWTYQGTTWQWDLPIPLSLYIDYLERPRPRSGAYYINMARDPGDDAYMDQLIEKINASAAQAGYNETQKLDFVIAFVQSLPYTVDIETTPFDEYPRYPVQTLFDKGGDCEDTSILVAALLDRMGYDVALLLMPYAQHMAVGVALPYAFGSYYEHNGKKYFYLETTGEGWGIGQRPPDLTDTRAYVFPVRG